MHSARYLIAVSATLIQLLGLDVNACLNWQASQSTGKAKPSTSSSKKNMSTYFEIVRIGEAIDKAEGIRFAITAYRTPDGCTFTVSHHVFDSSSQAQSYYQRKTEKAEKIVEQGNKTDRSGKTVGDRARVVFGEEGSKTKMQAVIWTAGPHYYEILSYRDKHISELEKQLSE